MTAWADTMSRADTHQALFYRDAEEYLGGISAFIAPALEADEPVAMAVPAPKHELLRGELGASEADIELLDMFELGRNPGRIIPAVQAMIDRHGSRPLHYVGEPIWPGRSAEEIREATRHEALINLAWPNATIRVLCPYDEVHLHDSVLLDAERTHPRLVRGGRLEPSAAYDGPIVPPGCEQPLPPAPSESVELPFHTDDLRQLRRALAQRAREAGLSKDRAAELVLAVNELATNTVKHAHSRGILRFWRAPQEVVCEVEDSGYIADPLAGRRHTLSGAGGLGLWMVNHLCDLVEVRTSPTGTTVRVHVRVGGPHGRHNEGTTVVSPA